MPCAPRPASSGGGGGGVLNIPRRPSRRVVLRGGRWRVSRACVAHDPPKTKRRFGFAARGAASAPGGRGARPRAPGASDRATRTAEKKVGRAQAQGRAPGRPLSACRVSTSRALSAAASFIPLAPLGAPRSAASPPSHPSKAHGVRMSRSEKGVGGGAAPRRQGVWCGRLRPPPSWGTLQRCLRAGHSRDCPRGQSGAPLGHAVGLGCALGADPGDGRGLCSPSTAAGAWRAAGRRAGARGRR